MSERTKFNYKVGRPRIFESPEEFTELANAYFVENEGGKISWTGLCLAVGASARATLESYKNGDKGKEFINPIKNALLVVEKYYEENVDGAKGIFILKNFGMRDNIDINADIKQQVTDLDDEALTEEIEDLQRQLDEAKGG